MDVSEAPVPAVPRLFPTTVVGSYPQPDWLINRQMLSKVVPRVPMREMWRVPEQFRAIEPDLEAVYNRHVPLDSGSTANHSRRSLDWHRTAIGTRTSHGIEAIRDGQDSGH